MRRKYNWGAFLRNFRTDAKRFAVKMLPIVPMKTQERACTSPIWYTPRE
ncbi:MAG: DUF3604 domain-containing protein [Pseudomonadota bacterium]